MKGGNYSLVSMREVLPKILQKGRPDGIGPLIRGCFVLCAMKRD